MPDNPRDFVGQHPVERLQQFVRMRYRLRREYKYSLHYDHSQDKEWGLSRDQLRATMHNYSGDVTEEYLPRFNYLSYLYQCVRQFWPSNVLEIGVQNGRSTFAILQGLADNNHGLLHSIDLIPAPKWFVAPLVPLALKRRWRYHEGSSEWRIGEILYHYPKIDMMYHDGVHDREQQLHEISQVWDAGAKIVVVDHFPEAHFETYVELLDPKPRKVLPDGVLIR